MIGRAVNQRDLAQLALHWVGLAWPAIGPETIAASCRASLLVGAPGVVVSTAVVDQLSEIHERLDRIWEQAQSDPSAAVLEVHPPRLELPPAERRRRRGGGQSDLTPVDAPELEPDHAPEPPPAPAPPAPLPRPGARPLRPRAERMAPRPAPEPVEIPPGVTPGGRSAAPGRPADKATADLRSSSPVAEAAAQKAAAPVSADLRSMDPTPPAPPNWLLAAEVAELLDTSEVTIGRWRAAGRFGAEGVGWVKCGRSFYYAPEAVEELESSEVPAGLDDLLSEVRAA